MGVTWIPDIYQNNYSSFWIRSQDDSHNGVVRGQFDLEDRKWHELYSGDYQTDWFGIPWYYLNENNHYKIIASAPDDDRGVKLYTSVLNGQDYIHFVDSHGKTIARVKVNTGGDTNCKLVFPAQGGFYVEPVNAGDPDPETIVRETGEIVKSSLDAVATVVAAAM